jgi:hypothetical protein
MKGLTGPRYNTFAGYTPPNVDIGPWQLNPARATAAKGGSIEGYPHGGPIPLGPGMFDVVKERQQEEYGGGNPWFDNNPIFAMLRNRGMLVPVDQGASYPSVRPVGMEEITETQEVLDEHGRPIYGNLVDPEDRFLKAAKGGLTETGNKELKSGSFVIPADVVSDVGDGSSSSGHRRLSQRFDDGSYARGGLSGPIKGPGGGLDDLIQTSIDGVRSARLSNDEFVVPQDIVEQEGRKAGAKTKGQAQKKGAEQLYAFMKDVRLKKHNTPSQPKALRMAGLRNIV